jgi:hypothetical protein
MNSAWERGIRVCAASALLLVFVFACASLREFSKPSASEPKESSQPQALLRPEPPSPPPESDSARYRHLPPPFPLLAQAPAPESPRRILTSVYDYLSSAGQETPGYGLYSYVLFPMYSRRAEHFLAEVFTTTGYQGVSLIDAGYLNVMYLPTRAGKMRASSAPSGHEFATELYDYALAQKLLAQLCARPAEVIRDLCTTDLSRGPYLLTYGRPMSTLWPVPPPYLVLDLSKVHARAFGEFIAAYKEQVKRPEYPDRGRLDILRLRVLSIILTAADWLAPTQSALADILRVAEGKGGAPD